MIFHFKSYVAGRVLFPIIIIKMCNFIQLFIIFLQLFFFFPQPTTTTSARNNNNNNNSSNNNNTP